MIKKENSDEEKMGGFQSFLNLEAGKALSASRALPKPASPPLQITQQLSTRQLPSALDPLISTFRFWRIKSLSSLIYCIYNRGSGAEGFPCFKRRSLPLLFNILSFLLFLLIYIESDLLHVASLVESLILDFSQSYRSRLKLQGYCCESLTAVWPPTDQPELSTRSSTAACRQDLDANRCSCILLMVTCICGRNQFKTFLRRG